MCLSSEKRTEVSVCEKGMQGIIPQYSDQKYAMMFQGDTQLWEFAERTQDENLTDELVICIYILILYIRHSYWQWSTKSILLDVV